MERNSRLLTITYSNDNDKVISSAYIPILEAKHTLNNLNEFIFKVEMKKDEKTEGLKEGSCEIEEICSGENVPYYSNGIKERRLMKYITCYWKYGSNQRERKFIIIRLQKWKKENDLWSVDYLYDVQMEWGICVLCEYEYLLLFRKMLDKMVNNL